MRLIFSRDRAAQLDLLLRSLDRNDGSPEDTLVIWQATTGRHRAGYALVAQEHDPDEWREQVDFNTDLRAALTWGDPMVTFLCDDDVLYRPVPDLGQHDLEHDERILTFSLRLADPWGKPWHWHDLPRHDRGYPGSIDGHTFRVSDVLRMIGGDSIENPLMLETVLAHRCEGWHGRPLMAAYPEQALVGVPVNTVADDQRRPHGDVFPQPADKLNARFLAGERINLDALDFTGADGCLYEVSFAWQAA